MNLENNIVSKSIKYCKARNINVEVLKKYINTKTGICYLLIRFWHSPSMSTLRVLPRSDIYNNSNILIDLGADVSDLKSLVKRISQQESQLDISYTHTDIGWSYLEESKVFQGSTSYPIESEYSGEIDITPKGSYAGWLKTVKEYAMPQVALQLAVVLGLSAVAVGFLKDELDGSLFVHLYGASSKGKTTFAMLAVSTAGNPNPTDKNTLMSDWSDTANYRISMLANNNGYPVVYDELSKCNQKDISDFCYNVANGRDKGRLNSNAERKDVPTWSTTVISTGENSLLAQCNNNGGLLVRVLELSIDTITESANNAEQLKQGIIKNYGFANTKFAKCLLNNEEVVKNKFYKWRNKIENDIPVKNSLISRLSKRLAVIMLTAEIAKKIFKLDFDIPKIEKILIDSVIKQNERHPFDIGESLIQYLLQDMVSHSEHYQKCLQFGFQDEQCRNLTAVIKQTNSKRLNDNEVSNFEIVYIPLKFEELLNKGGFTDTNLCLSELKKRNYLVTEKSHNKVKRTIDGKQIRAYAVRLPTTLFNPDFE